MNFNKQLIKKYEKIRSPYYTTYPTGAEWKDKFSSLDYLKALKQSLPKNKKIPIALYIHIPFCKKLCYFCFCITNITSNREKINKFTKYLFREIDMLRDFCKDNSILLDVKDIHLGGGTPTYLKRQEFDSMIKRLQTIADIENLDEFAMEIDPRTVTKEDMKYYYEKGISRISFGIQDFDLKVQKAVNRVHPPELIKELIAPEIRKWSVNFDLIYGLPFQTKETFRKTIEEVKKLNPDRISLYNYDHTPDLLKHQSIMKESDMPSINEKIEMYLESVKDLLNSGYQWIGIDHFAKYSDTLAQAAKNKTLGRNLNGYTTRTNYNVEIGLGPSSIASFGNHYVQNIKALGDYYKAIDDGNFPVLRGCKLSQDDSIRRDVITSLICNGRIDFELIGAKHKIIFGNYFYDELSNMDNFIQDDLIELNLKELIVKPMGKIFVQHIAKVFDRYLQQENKTYVRTHEAIKIEANGETKCIYDCDGEVESLSKVSRDGRTKENFNRCKKCGAVQ